MKLFHSSIFFIFIGLIIFALQKLGFNSYLHQYIWVIFVFFLALGFLNFTLMKFAFEKNKEKFIAFFMASVVLRLILSIVFLGAFIFIKLQNIQLFVINFIVLYLCVLAFEIFENIRNLRQN